MNCTLNFRVSYFFLVYLWVKEIEREAHLWIRIEQTHKIHILLFDKLQTAYTTSRK